MGCCASTHPDATPEDLAMDKVIGKDVKKARSQDDKEFKLLLLGAGESGKSTFFKQMKILYQKGFSEVEKKEYTEAVQSNTIQAMKILINALTKLDLPLKEKSYKEDGKLVMNFTYENGFPENIAAAIKHLWEAPQIREAFERRSAFQISDSANYFFDNIDRVASPSYVPTEEDVLRARIRTTGIVEGNFDYQKKHVRIYDVGGQRNERRKWIHCFEGCQAVIFFVALSEYNQTLYEDDTTNRMMESLLLFEEICNSRWFKDTNMIIFFNKADLFKEKIQKVDLNVCFPEYKGGKDYEKALSFISKKFQEKNRNPKKSVYTHPTTATDTENIRTLMNDLSDILLRGNLDIMGF